MSLSEASWVSPKTPCVGGFRVDIAEEREEAGASTAGGAGGAVQVLELDLEGGGLGFGCVEVVEERLDLVGVGGTEEANRLAERLTEKMEHAFEGSGRIVLEVGCQRLKGVIDGDVVEFCS